MIPQKGQEFKVNEEIVVIVSVYEIYNFYHKDITYNVFYEYKNDINLNRAKAIVIREKQFYPGCPIIPINLIGKVFYWKPI